MATYDIGFVYVLSNGSMPGLVKIGHTGLLPDDRARKLFTTGVPEPFTIELRLTTSSAQAVERDAHELLKVFRHHPKREFFKMPISEAIAGVQAAALTANGIASWRSEKVHYVRHGDRLTIRLRARQVLVVLRYSHLFALTADVLDIWQAHADGDYIEFFGTDDSTAVAGLSDYDPEGDADPVPYLDRSASVPNISINGRERLLPGDRLVWIGRSEGVEVPAFATFEMTSYCQVAGRTYDPQFSPEGFPLLLNALVDSMTAPMVEVAQRALALPPPRTWTPSQERDPDVWTQIGGNPAEPETWLTQLKVPPKRRR